MRPQLNCYGHPFMHTPRLDDFAAKATLFNRAYVQYAFCAPSRNSFMVCRPPPPAARVCMHYPQSIIRHDAANLNGVAS